MSRGRGGSFRGRGGVKKERIGGQEESWDRESNFLIDSKPREFYPEIQITKPPPPSRLERAQYRHFQEFRKHVRAGPLFTVLDDHARVGKTAARRAATFNPFGDMPTYTQKYKPPSKALPRFDTRKYSFALFPKELWDVITPKKSTQRAPVRISGLARVPKGKNEAIQRQRKPEVDDEDHRRKTEDEDDEEAAAVEDDAVLSESNPEDDFEDNDSEMAEDYNAETYFDPGEDDAEGMDGDGGDDGGFD